MADRTERERLVDVIAGVASEMGASVGPGGFEGPMGQAVREWSDRLTLAAADLLSGEPGVDENGYPLERSFR